MPNKADQLQQRLIVQREQLRIQKEGELSNGSQVDNSGVDLEKGGRLAPHQRSQAAQSSPGDSQDAIDIVKVQSIDGREHQSVGLRCYGCLRVCDSCIQPSNTAAHANRASSVGTVDADVV
jgi:hypothetical protein